MLFWLTATSILCNCIFHCIIFTLPFFSTFLHTLWYLYSNSTRKTSSSNDRKKKDLEKAYLKASEKRWKLPTKMEESSKKQEPTVSAANYYLLQISSFFPLQLFPLPWKIHILLTWNSIFLFIFKKPKVNSICCCFVHLPFGVPVAQNRFEGNIPNII